jgi:isopropylmalate/homocitrate/citramalate synthase
MAAIKAASGVWDKVYASTTYLGIGERAGNAETEKVLLNLYLHYGVNKYEGKTEKLKSTADYIGESHRLHRSAKQGNRRRLRLRT